MLKTSQVLELSFRLGVRCVSVYAFAIDNFRRSPEEVTALMDLCEEKLYTLCEHGCVRLLSFCDITVIFSRRDLLEEYGVRLNVLGRTSLLPEKVQMAAKKAHQVTRHNKRCAYLFVNKQFSMLLLRAILNVMMPYASRDEMTTAMQKVGQKALQGELSLRYLTILL